MSDLAGKRILIVGAGIWQVPLIRRARALGLFVIATDRDPDAPGFRDAGASVVVDVTDGPRTLAAAREWQVQAVATDQSDAAVPTAAFVADRLGLPGIGRDVAHAATNKWAMRERCRLAGLDLPRYRRALTLGEARDALLDVGLPAVVKPADSQSSRGVRIVEGENALEPAFLAAMSHSRGREVLVEELMRGEECSVEGVVDGNGPRALTLSRKWKSAPPHRFDTRLIYPGDFPSHIRRSAFECSESVIRALGVPFGVTHTEIMIGPDGRCRLIEAAARGCGSRVASDLLPILVGIDVSEMLIRLAFGETPQAEPVECAEMCLLQFLYLPPGTVREIHGLGGARQVPGVIDVAFTVDVGRQIGSITDGRSRPGYLLAHARSQRELDVVASRALEALLVHVEDPSGRLMAVGGAQLVAWSEAVGPGQGSDRSPLPDPMAQVWSRCSHAQLG